MERTTTTTKTSVRHLRLFAIGSATVASAFWVWAIVNTIKGRPDLGIVSFLAVMLSSAGLLRLAATKPERPLRNDNDNNKASANANACASRCVVASHGLVALNYAAGAAVVLVRSFVAEEDDNDDNNNSNTGFAIYCIVFAIAWVASAGLGWWLLKQHRGGASSSTEETAGTHDQESGRVDVDTHNTKD